MRISVSVFVKKLLIILSVLLLSFSLESTHTKENLAQSYFNNGLINFRQGNYKGAINDFTKAYFYDKDGYYGQLAYLYLGMSYAYISYYTGNKAGVFSAIGYLNMYPYYYKMPAYINLQREFIGNCYLLLGMYDRAKDIFLDLYRAVGSNHYLLKFLYADALSGGQNYELLNTIPESEDQLYYLVKGFILFNSGDYKASVESLSHARNINRYLENDPEFLYRYAIGYYMLGDWRRALFYFEILDRKDLYGKYRSATNYYLSIIYLKSKNYTDAKRRIELLKQDGGIVYDLLYSQLWLFNDFLDKYKDSFRNYKKELVNIGWIYLNKVYSLPAILGLYYYSVNEKKFEDKTLLSNAKIALLDTIAIEDIRIELKPLFASVKEAYKSLDPYGEHGGFLIELYNVNKNNYKTLFGMEKLARYVVYEGKLDFKGVVEEVDEPLKSFLLGQIMLMEGNKEGLKLLSNSLKGLDGEDKTEALILLYVYNKDMKGLEQLLNMADIEKSKRLNGYIPIIYLELGDYYYGRRDYQKAKEYYKKYLEIEKEDEVYWLTAYKLVKVSNILKDMETLNWVVKKAEKTDNIIGRSILALWG
mgnify:CR=1 FL=1